MSIAPRIRTRSGRLLLVGLLLAVPGSLGACGEPPGLQAAGVAPTPSRTPTAAPTTAPTSVVTPPPTAPALPTPAFGEYTAVDCQGRPGTDQVLALLRRDSRLLPSSAKVKVAVPPRCAGDWQYTVIEVNGREPLQVVSSGPSRSLKLVTAGTYVCDARVRVAAPPGIRTLACETGAAPATAL